MRDTDGNPVDSLADVPRTERLELFKQGTYRRLDIDASRKLGDVIRHPKYGRGVLVEITTLRGQVTRQVFRFGR